MSPSPPPEQAEQAIDRAIRSTAETMGELMEFWNFKPSMGKVWTALYLSQEPLSAEQIGHITGLSGGSVSMTLNDLRHWGVVHQVRQPGNRRRLYEPETDIQAMITRVFRQRELRMVQRALKQLQEANDLLEAEAGTHDPRVMLRGRFVATRVGQLLDLTRTGERMLDRFARAGEFDLTPLRNLLGSIRRR